MESLVRFRIQQILALIFIKMKKFPGEVTLFSMEGNHPPIVGAEVIDHMGSLRGTIATRQIRCSVSTFIVRSYFPVIIFILFSGYK